MWGHGKGRMTRASTHVQDSVVGLRMRQRHQTLGDVLLDLAVARAFMGNRSDGTHLPDTERIVDAVRRTLEA